jgi:glycosyltransferase involved in cell wall biosynthesis
MRILLIPPSDYLGHPNPGRVHHIFERISQLGDDVYVVRFTLYEKTVRRTNTTIISLGDKRVDSLSAYYLLNTGVFIKSILRAISEHDVEIVVYANLYPPYVIRRFVPNDVSGVVDMLDHYPKIAASQAPTVIPKEVLSPVFEHMMKSTLEGSDVTIACSYALAEYARHNGARAVYRIPNGVEESFFNNYETDGHEIRRKLGISERDVVLCFVGNIEYWLNLEEFLLAMRSVKKSTGKSIKLLLVGGKLRTTYADKLNNLVSLLGLGDDVVRVGFVPHEEVPKYIAASDMGLIPKNTEDPVSSYSFPLKLWEYLAQGKPVISTSIPEVLIVGRGVVSIADTENEYVAHMTNFLNDREAFMKQAQLGRSLAKEHTWGKIAANYRTLLQTLC